MAGILAGTCSRACEPERDLSQEQTHGRTSWIRRVSLNATPASQAPDDEATATADAMVKRFVDSWNAADGVAYGEGYWPDAELVDPSGQVWPGRSAIAQMHVDLWAGNFTGSRITGKTRRIQRLSPDFLIVDVDLELSNIQGLPPGGLADDAGVVRTHLKHILEKRDGVWRILSAQNTFLARHPPSA
jgi:uncharacterized protein (TIGR02246 family)